ncbi:MHC2 [Mytilus edulis]|uniref:MHC2 n=1 Tax=Mytilus edulis TaxID=6550 RepID=A0A8S3UP88_MYTED|nr:MHC2 [Mytilus edulis]
MWIGTSMRLDTQLNSQQVYRSAGRQVSRSTGQQVDRSAGRQVSKSTGQQVDRSAGRQVSRTTDAELCETGLTNVIIENCPDMFQTQTILDIMNKYGEVYTCKCRSGSLKREPGSVTDTKTVTNTWYIELIKLNQTIPPCITLGEFHINIFVENSIPHVNEYRD